MILFWRNLKNYYLKTIMTRPAIYYRAIRRSFIPKIKYPIIIEAPRAKNV